MGKFNEALKALVKKRPVKITELAEKLQVSRSYLSVVINQDQTPSDDLIRKLATELGCSQEETYKLLMLAHEDRAIQVEEPLDPTTYLKSRLGELEERVPRRHLEVLGGSFENVSLSPRGAIRETRPCFKASWESDFNAQLESAELVLVNEWGEILLQETITEIAREGNFASFEFPLAEGLELERGQQFRWQVYLNLDENGRKKRRYLDEIMFEVISVEDEIKVLQYEKACRKRLIIEFLQSNLFSDAISEAEEIKKFEERIAALGQEGTEEANSLIEMIKDFALHYPYSSI